MIVYLQISVKNLELMQCLKPEYNLNQNRPNFCFLEELLFLFSFNYLLIEVSIVGELHNDTDLEKTVPEIFAFEKSFFISDNGGIIDGS